MSVTYEKAFTVDSRDVDYTGCARPSALLEYLQETATLAALALHVSGRETLEKYNCFWMIARVWIRLDEPLRWNETFNVRTWHRGGQGVSTYRDFDILKGDRVVGEAVSTWVLADRDTGKLMRLDRLEEFRGTDGGGLCKDIKIHRPKLPGDMLPAQVRTLGYSDTDINGHVNNARYADFACDALHLERLLERGGHVSQIQIGYLAQCMAGETISLEAGQDETGAWYVRGTGADGRGRFEYMQRISRYGKGVCPP